MSYSYKRRLYLLACLVFVLSIPWAQDVNITYPVDEIERKLIHEDFCNDQHIYFFRRLIEVHR